MLGPLLDRLSSWIHRGNIGRPAVCSFEDDWCPGARFEPKRWHPAGFEPATVGLEVLSVIWGLSDNV